MASNKSKYIDTNNIGRWSSALGFSFPRNEPEEKIFDKLYSDYDFQLEGVKIDANKLIAEIESDGNKESMSSEWKMAARNYGALPDHIINKMKKNQDGKEGDSQ